MFLNEKDAVAELLDIPNDTTIISLFPVAFTLGTDFKPTSRRYPARDITYFDRYGHTLAHEHSEPRSYADGPGVAVEVDIKAKPAVVWALVSDVDLPGQFSEEFQGATWDDPDAEPAVGSSFTGHNRHPAIGEWSTTSYVADWEPPKRFGWHVSDLEEPSAQWRFTIEQVPGGCRLRFQVRLGPGPSGLSPAIEAMPDKEPAILARRQNEHRANMERTIDGIREQAEAGSRPTDSGFPGLGN
ncbi:MAG: SRPBCC family protein [Actinomycetia bacterium]|nr:SRPBCC family protein [Actinomycetes bacterium]MCP4087332.1 SRPBCC family protein [Actinomycetes bacterium]